MSYVQVIQRRGSYQQGEKINFTRGWSEYKSGFGNLNAEFWLGNDLISRLTNRQPVKLRIELQDFDRQSVFAEYSTFRRYHFSFHVVFSNI